MLALFALPLVLLGVEPTPERPEYRFAAQLSRADLPLRTPGTVRVIIEPRSDKKVNLKSPLRVEFDGQGVRFQKSPLLAADARAGTSSVAFEARFEGTTVGPAQVRLRALFFICDERVCERRVETKSLTLSVRDASGSR